MIDRLSPDLGNMEWFVQTPEYIFGDTLFHSRLLAVFSPESCFSEYTLFHQEWCAYGA
jgi:hypothetical protein